MQILIATETYPPSVNGAAVFTQRLARGLARRGHQLAVAAPSPTGRPFREAGDPVLTLYRIRSLPTPYPRQRCALLTPRGAQRLLATVRPDLLHVQNHFVLGRTLARAARARGIPVVGTNHFMPENMLPHVPWILDFGQARERLHRELWRQCVSLYSRLDAVTTPTRAAADLLRAQGLAVPIHVISNGIDPKRFHPAADRDVALRAGPLGPTVLYVGRLDPDKDVATIICAMPHLLQRVGAVLVLGGQGVRASALRRLSETLDISAWVRFPGFVPDEQLPDLYRSAAVFVMPSPHELQSLATLEAMASGLPVVAANAGALPELVRDGENGLLFPSGDPVALAGRIARLLADPLEAARMGEASRAIAERHDIGLTLRAFEGLYDELVQRAPTRRSAAIST
jgi:glycosyltransferase involved in cell wall biosynthesis